jgi:hypothetical protein
MINTWLGSASVVDVNVAWTDFLSWIGIWKVTNFTIMREWKSLFMNGFEWKNLIYTMMEFLNSCQDESNTSMCPGITLKNDATQVD